MEESNTLINIATIIQISKDIMLNTKRQCMKDVNTFAGNVTIKQLQREILFEFMSLNSSIVHDSVNIPLQATQP